MNVAIIGLGLIGSKYDDNLNTSYSHRNSILRNISYSDKFYIDSNLENIKYIAFKDKAKFSRNINDLPKVLNLVIISVPTKFHLEIYLKLTAKSEVETIIFEKPVGEDYLQSKIIFEESIKNNQNIYVNYMRNTLPETSEIYDYIKKNSLRNFDIEISTSGSFLNNGSHFLALVAYLTNIPLDKLELKNLNERIKIMEFEENRILIKSFPKTKYPFFKVNIFFDSGQIEYDEIDYCWKIYNFKENSSIKSNKLYLNKKLKLNLNFAQDYFLRYVLSGEKPNIKKIDLKTAMMIHKLVI